MTRREWLYASFAGIAQSSQRGTNIGRRIPPADQSMRDPKFLAFRNSALAAAARRDAAWFQANLAPEPLSSFGGDSTVDDFVSFWKLNEPAASPFWGEIRKVLRMGGCFTGTDEFAAPYVYALFPNDIDPYEYEVVVKSGAVLRAEPDPKAAVVETLRWDILEIQAFNDEPWRFVRSASGKLGYVERSSLRSPIDYRAVFKRIEGRWLLWAFVGGD